MTSLSSGEYFKSTVYLPPRGTLQMALFFGSIATVSGMYVIREVAVRQEEVMPSAGSLLLIIVGAISIVMLFAAMRTSVFVKREGFEISISNEGLRLQHRNWKWHDVEKIRFVENLAPGSNSSVIRMHIEIAWRSGKSIRFDAESFAKAEIEKMNEICARKCSG